MRRVRSGKSLALTARDLVIFRALADYRYLRSTYLHAFAGGASETRFKERLGDLFHEGYINRPLKQWEFARARYEPAVYEIDEGAKRVLAEEAAFFEPRTYLSSGAHRQFAHAQMICECLASIELAIGMQKGLRFISWGEILARAPAETRAAPAPFRLPLPSGALIPDGLFGIAYRSGDKPGYRFFALEVDRGTMPVARSDPRQSSYLAKLNAYREAIEQRLHKTHWGISSLFLLTVTTSEARVNEMLRVLESADGDPLFLFKAVEPSALTKPLPELLHEPWQRSAHAPLSIGEAA